MNTLIYNKINQKKETIKWGMLENLDSGEKFLEIIFNAKNIIKRKKVSVYNEETLTLHFPDDNLVLTFEVKDKDEILRLIEESI